MKVFKVRAYECTGCGQQTTAFRWDSDLIPPCESCGAIVRETDTTHGQAPAVVDDTVIGGRVCETLGHEPFFYTSKTQLRREAERRGCVNVVRHDDAYYATQRKRHDEQLRDTKQVRT